MDKDKNIIAYRLYRQHTTFANTGFVKDLSKLGRDLNKLIMIDNIPENFRFQTNNGLWTRTWTEDMKCKELNDFIRILKDIYEINPNDVKPLIKKIKEEVNLKLNKNISNPYAKLEVKI